VAAALPISGLSPVILQTAYADRANLLGRLEFPRVFRGRELTPKSRRIASGVTSIDHLLGGGIVRGRISEILCPNGSGKTSLAMAFAARVTRIEAAAWIEANDSLDPESVIAAGIEPARMLWVSGNRSNLQARTAGFRPDENPDAAVSPNRGRRHLAITLLKTAEWIMAAGGFGLLVIDFGNSIRFIPQSAALRLARAAERSGAAVLVIADNRMCGTFSALTLLLNRRRANFKCTTRSSHATQSTHTTFDGQSIKARVMRNKLGGSGGIALWSTAANPSPLEGCDPDTDQDLFHRPAVLRFAPGGVAGRSTTAIAQTAISQIAIAIDGTG
jgi:hypothetical protein